MQYQRRDFGVNTVDADHVAIHFEGGDLHLSFVDWQETARSVTFRNVLAFRWQEHDEPVPRIDGTFEVTESHWLDRQAKLQSVPPENFSHYLLCFNACGSLDVLASKMSGC